MTKQLRRADRDPFVRMLFRQLPGAVWTTDRDLCLTYVAGRLANDMGPRVGPGVTIPEVVGTRDPANRVIASHRAAIAGEPQSFEYQFNGRWYEVFVDPLRCEAGDVAGCIAAAFDITEQRSTQDRLARSEALLSQAQRVAHIGSFEWEIASDVVTWSDELHRIHGLEPGRFAGTYQAFLERVHPDDLEHAKSAIFDALHKGGPFVYEHRSIRSDGSVRVLHTRGDVVRNDDGQAVRIAGCCWDVTELRQAMDNLERARSLLKAALEATADGLLVVDRSGAVTACNERFLSLWNIPRDMVCQDDNHEVLLSYVRDQIDDPAQFLSKTNQLYRHPELESFDVLHFKDGRVFERYSRPQRLGKQIAGRVWSFRDVTERDSLLQRALFMADATRLLSSLDIESALDSVAHLAVPFMGDACAIDLLGNGHPRRAVVASRENSESFKSELQSSVLAGNSTIYSTSKRSCMAVPLVVKDMVAGAMTFVGSPSRRYDKRDLQFAEILAGRAALAVENASLYRKAQEALQARDEFLTIAAHEIRGPLTSIHLAVQGLKNGKAPVSATQELLEIIEREDRRLATWVDELLDLGRIQKGRMYFKFEDVDVGDVVREAVNELAAERTATGSALSISTEGRTVGQWDKSALKQVVTNLLSNAIKFGDGKPITVSVRGGEGHTTIEVKDNGIGMAPDVLDHLFEPFERRVSVRNYGGLGLGLFIVRTIVHGLGGTVSVNSKPNEGATFTVDLPNVRDQQ